MQGTMRSWARLAARFGPRAPAFVGPVGRSFHGRVSNAGSRFYSAGPKPQTGGNRVVLYASGTAALAGSAVVFTDEVKNGIETAERSGRVGYALLVCVNDYRTTLNKIKEITDATEKSDLLHACHQRCANRTLKVLEKNGGIFIKLGQHLSAMNYLLPIEWTTTFIPLQDKCPISSFESIQAVFLKDTGKDLMEVFSEFDPTPIGAASLAQVHMARLRETGQEVAVKVQHPTLESLRSTRSTEDLNGSPRSDIFVKGLGSPAILGEGFKRVHQEREEREREVEVPRVEEPEEELVEADIEPLQEDTPQEEEAIKIEEPQVEETVIEELPEQVSKPESPEPEEPQFEEPQLEEPNIPEPEKITMGDIEERPQSRHTASPPPPLQLSPPEEPTHSPQSYSPQPPSPPPKDTPPLRSATSNITTNTISSTSSEFFVPRHGRAGSIYTLSRASFTNQLAQLTALQLPSSESLSSKVAAIPTAHAANNALINAAEQIRGWIHKATEVIEGLDSDDDVEWAAAGGREGLAEVEQAIARFEELINIYVSAIEDLQCRPDISDVSPNDLQKAVVQMDAILAEWLRIRKSLQKVKEQVEIAMEWGELWTNVLGDIQDEMDELSRLVFEMEERRHKSVMAESGDIDNLGTIVEEVPNTTRLGAQNRFSMPPFPLSPGSPGTPSLNLDDSSLLALFARMQPLRASLDFLPMRLSAFTMRASDSFPTACDELSMRQTALDNSYKKLEKEAESLRKELGEDRWVTVFRNAGRQAQKMYESVHRSVDKLRDAIQAGLHPANQPLITEKIESYEAKKVHYGPAIERVLSIIDKGVKDRLTVNGEILRLHMETKERWVELKKEMSEMDEVLEEVQGELRTQQLRDSVSSLMSAGDGQSTVGSGAETPGSSPPSSIVMSVLPKTPLSGGKRLRAATAGSLPQPGRRYSSLPPPQAHQTIARKASASRLSVVGGMSSGPKTPNRLTRPPSTSDLRPKWNSSTNTNNLDTGHNFVPLTLTTPSPYAKRPASVAPGQMRSGTTLSPHSSGSRLPTLKNSASPRSSTASPIPMEDTPTRTTSRLSFRDRLGGLGPGPYSQQTLQKARGQSTSGSSPGGSNGKDVRRASYHPRVSGDLGSSPSRPASSMAFNRRASVLPVPSFGGRARAGSTDGNSVRGTSRLGFRKADKDGSKDKEKEAPKPRWKF